MSKSEKDSKWSNFSDLDYVLPTINWHKSLTKETLQEWIVKFHEQIRLFPTLPTGRNLDDES